MGHYSIQDYEGKAIYLCDDTVGARGLQKVTTVVDNQDCIDIILIYTNNEGKAQKVIDEIFSHLPHKPVGNIIVDVILEVTAVGGILNINFEQGNYHKKFNNPYLDPDVKHNVKNKSKENNMPPEYSPAKAETGTSLPGKIIILPVGIIITAVVLIIFFLRPPGAEPDQASRLLEVTAEIPDKETPREQPKETPTPTAHLAKSNNNKITTKKVTNVPQKVVDTTTEKDKDNSPALRAPRFPEKHIIRSQETLRKISLKYFQDEYHVWHLANVNKITNPDIIFPGTNIRVTPVTNRSTLYPPGK